MKKFVLIAALALASSTASAGYTYCDLLGGKACKIYDYAPAEGR